MIVNNPSLIILVDGYYAYEGDGFVHIRKRGDTKNIALCTKNSKNYYTVNPHKVINCPKCKQLYRLAHKK